MNAALRACAERNHVTHCNEFKVQYLSLKDQRQHKMEEAQARRRSSRSSGLPRDQAMQRSRGASPVLPGEFQMVNSTSGSSYSRMLGP